MKNQFKKPYYKHFYNPDKNELRVLILVIIK